MLNMLGILYIVLASIIISATAVQDENSNRVASWKLEVTNSLRHNFQDVACSIGLFPLSISALDPKRLNIRNNTINIRKIIPNERELHFLRVAPESLTAVDEKVPDFAAKREYSYDRWGNTKELRWEVPDTHPGQNRNNCISMTNLASEGLPVSFYQEFRDVDRIPYIIYMRDGFIHPSGSVATSCGYYQGQEGCETRWNRAKDWYQRCKKAITDFTTNNEENNNDKRGTNPDWAIFSHLLATADSRRSSESEVALWQTCMTFAEEDTPFGGKFHPYFPNVTRPAFVDTVVVIPALWDFNYHHFIADSVARLAPLLPLLRRRKDILIHIRGAEVYDGMYYTDPRFIESASNMRMRFLSLLLDEDESLKSRIVTGPVVAKMIILPRPTRCSYALSNPIELLKLRQHMISATLKNVIRDGSTSTNDNWQQSIHHFLFLIKALLTPPPKSQNEVAPRSSSNSVDTHQEQSKKNSSPQPISQTTSKHRKAERKNIHGGNRSNSKKNKQAPHKNADVLPEGEEDAYLLPARRLEQVGNLAAHQLTDVLPTEETLEQLGEFEPGERSGTNTMIQQPSHTPPSSSAKQQNPLKLPADYQPPARKKIVLMQRHTDFASSDRDWSDRTTHRLKYALEHTFPNHDVVIISSKKTSARSSQPGPSSRVCLHCDYLHFMTADVVVAAHGAGLTNLLLVSPNTVVIEIAGEVKDVNLPVCGYYSPLASLVGAHHFLYAHDMHKPFGVQVADTKKSKLREEGTIIISEREKQEREESAKNADNPDFALPVHDIARKARHFYDTIQRHRLQVQQSSSTWSDKPLSHVLSSNEKDIPKPLLSFLEPDSVVHRPEVMPRLHLVQAPPHLLFIRVENSTQGRISARP